ncbi:MAG: gliding motility-associated C-terminal domain-containing protein, partial [Sphingobacteriales bacterium]
VLGADKNVSLCHGQVVNLTSQYNTTGLSAVWTFHNVPVPDPTSAGINGTYQLVASSMHGCYDTAMVNLNIHPPVVANAGQDVTIEYNVPHRLLGSGGGSYLWSPANLVSNPRVYNPQVRLTNDQQFYLQVTNDAGCSAVDTINIKVLKGPGIYVPTAFTPNGDGLNDVFRPTAVGISKLEYFRVFNRYGELVFETSEINKGWDGTHKGVKQNIGNYIWTLKGTDRYNREQVMNGYVVLVR